MLALLFGTLACPAPYTSTATGCYHVTSERSSHWGCAALCGSNASLACIGSAEENAVVTSVAVEQVGEGTKVWLGNYQSADGAEPGGGWDMCMSGSTQAFVNWVPGEPNVGGKDCAVLDTGELDGGTGRWADGPCGYSYPCLCKHGADPAPEYAAFAEALQAAQAQDFTIYLVIVPTASLLPLLLWGCYSCVSRRFGRVPPDGRKPRHSARREAVDERKHDADQSDTHRPKRQS